MALDGAMLSQIAYEIQEVLLGARVDKIYQPPGRRSQWHFEPMGRR